MLRSNARRVLLVGQMMVIALLPGAALADWGFNLVIGPRYLGDEIWSPIDGDAAWGVDFSWGKESWPVRMALGFFGSGDDNEDECFNYPFGEEVCPRDLRGTVLERDIFELSLGVLKKWSVARSFEAYLGGGLTSVSVEVERRSKGKSVDDESGGGYAQAGFLWAPRSRDESRVHFHIGIDARYVGGTDLELFNTPVDADYFQVGVVLGIDF